MLPERKTCSGACRVAASRALTAVFEEIFTDFFRVFGKPGEPGTPVSTRVDTPND